MSTIPSDVAFTPTVKAFQTAKGSREAYARMENGDGWETTVTPELADFIARQDMFFLGTANAAAQPYIQHRGGPPGFLKVLDEHTLAFADFGGNQQYITLGNLQENQKAIIFLMDWVERIRIKLWGTAHVIEDASSPSPRGEGQPPSSPSPLVGEGWGEGHVDQQQSAAVQSTTATNTVIDPAALLEKLSDPSYPGKVERAIVFKLTTWDRNCPQHIQRRYPQSMIAPVVDHLKAHIAALENQVRELGGEPVAERG